MANKSAGKKTMDVSKPGDTAPDTSARPVLVTHRPMVQDPTVKEAKASDTPTESKPVTATHTAKVIQPVNNETSTDAPKEAAPAEPEKTESADSEPEKAEKTEEAKIAEEAAVVEAVADQATEDKKKQNKETDEDKARKVELQKLVDEKKYFVPIGQVGRRRNRRVVIVVLVILIVLAGAYLAVDAGVIETSIELPVELIKN